MIKTDEELHDLLGERLSVDDEYDVLIVSVYTFGNDPHVKTIMLAKKDPYPEEFTGAKETRMSLAEINAILQSA